MVDLEAPCVSPVTSMTGSRFTPRQQITLYDAAEWELFIREWATTLDGYVELKEFGGPGDRGVDVAGFKTEFGFEGPWDCFQGKHYAGSLTPSDAYIEMVKVLGHAVLGHYLVPDCYFFLAPRGCGNKLKQFLGQPTVLRDEFLASEALAAVRSDLRDQIRSLAESLDFSMFRSVELFDALVAHSHTPFHVARFGVSLGPRPLASVPPAEISDHEERYISQLVEVYAEKHPSETFDVESLSAHPLQGVHFQRQRVSFYKAESLRLYARDSVPEGTFEALQDDVHAGVVEVSESDHSDGMTRLTQVLTTSTQLDLSSHTLVTVTSLDDRKGICHQLANDDRLTWVVGP